MSRHRSGGSPVRYRPVIWAAGVAGSLMMASVASAAWHAVGADNLETDIPLLQAAEVSSRSTGTEVTITVRTPKRQPPGVTYTVTRSTPRGDSVICSGSAPLVCRDPIGVAGASVSYTVVSNLTGHGQAVIALDTTTSPRSTSHRPSPTADRGAEPSKTTRHEETRAGSPSGVEPKSSPTLAAPSPPSPTSSPTTSGEPTPSSSTSPTVSPSSPSVSSTSPTVTPSGTTTTPVDVLVPPTATSG